jgi:hypothetical protein
VNSLLIAPFIGRVVLIGRVVPRHIGVVNSLLIALFIGRVVSRHIG